MASQLMLVLLLLLVAASRSSVLVHGTKTYIVYMGMKPDSIHPDALTSSHHELLATILPSFDAAKESLVYSYNQSMNGFAAILEPEHAAYIAALPGVVSVFESKTLEPYTTNSMAFLGLEDQYGNVPSDSIWTPTSQGKDIIIGIIDSGIWPESASFSDSTLGPIPARWKGTCQTAATFTKCNKKIIGARYFTPSNAEPAPEEYSPRDITGHGSHVASIAAGSFVQGANMVGFARGTAKGVAPQARIAVYKLCWAKSKCSEASLLAAIDKAIADGVDVINLSLGKKISSSYDMLSDGMAVGALHAIRSGVHVVTAGGNDGPLTDTISNIAPWMINVAASSIDREFHNDLVLGDNQVLRGRSFSVDKHAQQYPLVIAKEIPSSTSNASIASGCASGSLNASFAKGKIVVCEAGSGPDFPEKAKVIKEVGGIGLVIINNVPGAEVLFTYKYIIPGIHLGYTAGSKLTTYIKSSRTPVGYITLPETVLGYKPAPTMGFFSSIGPSAVASDVIKPDVTAPGVDILAAWSGANSTNNYEIVSGTSMASPHVAGVAALLKSLHPDWSPAAVQSAIMTTAYTINNNGVTIRDGFTVNAAGPFNYGSGHISPKAAADPGLVYNASAVDYAGFLCTLGYTATKVQQVVGVTPPSPCVKGSSNTLNYPSVAVSDLKGSVSIRRTVTNVGLAAATYNFYKTDPTGVSISANPTTLRFSKYGESQTFILTLKATQVSAGYVFGDFTWNDGKHSVRSPVAVKVVSTITVNSELKLVDSA